MNLKKKQNSPFSKEPEDLTSTSETSEVIELDFADVDLNSLSALELPNNWTRDRSTETSMTFLRPEKWYINGQRVVTELKVSRCTRSRDNTSGPKIEICSQGVTLDVIDSNLGNELVGLKLVETVTLLLTFLDSPESGLCCGFQMFSIEEKDLSTARVVEMRTIGNPLQESTTTSKRAFSQKCRLLSPPGQCCPSCALLKKRENEKQTRKSDEINPNCNDRWLSKEQLKSKLSALKRQLKNTSARETKLREKFEMDCIEMEASDSNDLASIMNNIQNPDVPPGMQILWEQQMKILQTKSKYGFRWHPKIIQLCLDLYCKNPHVLDSIREVIHLPSNKTIRFHKNKRQEKPGWQRQTVDWCHEKAKSQNLKDCDFWGGIVIDEMKIQENVEMVVKKGKDGIVHHSLVGFVQLGTLHEDMRKLEGKTETELASHVLQFMFLSDSGFRFPVAQFPSHDLTPSDLYDAFWKGVLMMLEYGFTIYWCILDGADVNRKFIELHFPGKDPIPHHFKAMNVFTGGPMVFMMDSKHNIKKVRNNILKSNNSVKPRCLMVGEKKILWSQLSAAYNYDQSETSIHIHERLTEQHFNLDAAAKMRNHLAEDVLDKKMLFLMKAYKQHLISTGKDGSALDACLELLEYTSGMVEFFSTSKHVVSSVNDNRIKGLTSFLKWMSTWKDSCKDAKHFISTKLWFDLQSMALGFQEIVNIKLAAFPNSVIKAWITNQDVVENHFCNVRACNGQNNNPTYKLQASTQNSIRIGQRTISTKCNARKR